MGRRSVLSFFLGLGALALLAVQVAEGQKSGQAQQPAPGGGGTTTSPTTPAPGPTPTTPTTPSTPSYPSPGQQQQGQGQTQSPSLRRPMWLSGAVVMEDGSKPPDTVTIELVSCSGIARPQAYTDSKGQFSFQAGQSLIPDASVGGARQGQAGLARGTGGSMGSGGASPSLSAGTGACELRASLPGYRSDSVNLVQRGTFDNPEVGTIVLHRLSGVGGSTISMTSLQAPRDAKSLFDKGLKSEDKGKWAEGEKHFGKAVSIYPRYATAWNEMGLCLESQQKFTEAREAYGKALAADSKFVKPYLQLAGIALKEKKWQEVLDTSGQVIRLNPNDFADAYFYSAVASFNLRDLNTADKQAVEASKRDSQHRFPKIEHLLGIIRAQKGDFAAAAEHLRAYLQLSPKAGDAGEVKGELEQVEKLVASRAQAGSTR